MTWITIKREDIWHALALVRQEALRNAGSIWCDLAVTDEEMGRLRGAEIAFSTNS